MWERFKKVSQTDFVASFDLTTVVSLLFFQFMMKHFVICNIIRSLTRNLFFGQVQIFDQVSFYCTQMSIAVHVFLIQMMSV